MSATLIAAEPAARYLTELQPALVERFDLLATAPGGVARLRELILTLAVRGKLVEQDPGDEPATKLLQAITGEKQQAMRLEGVRPPKPTPPVQEDEQWFAPPGSWAWTRLSDLVISSEAGWSPSCEEVPRQNGRWGVLKVSAVSWANSIQTPTRNFPQLWRPGLSTK